MSYSGKRYQSADFRWRGTRSRPVKVSAPGMDIHSGASADVLLAAGIREIPSSLALRQMHLLLPVYQVR